MPQQPYDKGSKYLVQQQARGILLLAGAKGVRSVRALPAELVQPRQIPDGLLEVFFEKRKEPNHVLVEVATYPEKRALKQALDDLTLARQYLKGKLPELLMLVLRPKGKFQISGEHEVASPLGWSKLSCSWKVVELWKVPAEDLLGTGEVSVFPWVPLARYDGPPAELLERCRDGIQQKASADARDNLLAVAQVLAQLKFPQPEMLALLGGSKVMTQFPLLNTLVAERLQQVILNLLKTRFKAVPDDVRRLVGEVKKEKNLDKLLYHAAMAETMEAFKEHLLK